MCPCGKDNVTASLKTTATVDKWKGALMDAKTKAYCWLGLIIALIAATCVRIELGPILAFAVGGYIVSLLRS